MGPWVTHRLGSAYEPKFMPSPILIGNDLNFEVDNWYLKGRWGGGT
jgi:hypothetical protein